ncbi:hypothetical protein LTR53_020293, partial [Teratosphaeriaceae sp. CCFEE 6253]
RDPRLRGLQRRLFRHRADRHHERHSPGHADQLQAAYARGPQDAPERCALSGARQSERWLLRHPTDPAHGWHRQPRVEDGDGKGCFLE